MSNNIIEISINNFKLSSDFLDYQYIIKDGVNSIIIPFIVLNNITINFIISKSILNDIIIVYNDIEYVVKTTSNFNLSFINSLINIENSSKEIILPVVVNTKLSFIGKNTNATQIFTSNTITKINSNWLHIDSINDELYKIDFINNNYKYNGTFDSNTFININLQISFTIAWIGSNDGNQVMKLNLNRVVDNSIIRSLNIRKTSAGTSIQSQLMNANFLTFVQGNNDPFVIDGFYFSIDTSLCDDISIDITDNTYRVIIFNDKIR